MLANMYSGYLYADKYVFWMSLRWQICILGVFTLANMYSGCLYAGNVDENYLMATTCYSTSIHGNGECSPAELP